MFSKSPEIKARLGSGVSIGIDMEPKPVKMTTGRGRSQSVIADKPLPKGDPISIVEVDGVEVKVERTPLRYEKIDHIFDDLPDFAQDILSQLHEQNNV